MVRLIHSVSISPDLSAKMKEKRIRPSDAFKRGVMLYLREADMTEEDNPLVLKEKINKYRIALEEKSQEYELLKEQYNKLKTNTEDDEKHEQ